jgi:hypothetical protein
MCSHCLLIRGPKGRLAFFCQLCYPLEIKKLHIYLLKNDNVVYVTCTGK